MENAYLLHRQTYHQVEGANFNEGAGQFAELTATDPCRLLLLDEEPLVAEMLGELLESRGFQVDLAGSTLELLQLARRKCFEAVLLSESRETSTITELIRMVRRIRPLIPVVVLSSKGDGSQLEFCNLVQLPKPLHIDQLVPAVNRALEEGRDYQLTMFELLSA